jgi:hypothetical protein
MSSVYIENVYTQNRMFIYFFSIFYYIRHTIVIFNFFSQAFLKLFCNIFARHCTYTYKYCLNIPWGKVIILLNNFKLNNKA